VQGRSGTTLKGRTTSIFGLDLSFGLCHLDFAERVSAFSIIEEIPSTKRQISNNIGARNI
jgi:hypothetical protein